MAWVMHPVVLPILKDERCDILLAQGARRRGGRGRLPHNCRPEGGAGGASGHAAAQLSDWHGRHAGG